MEGRASCLFVHFYNKKQRLPSHIQNLQIYPSIINRSYLWILDKMKRQSLYRQPSPDLFLKHGGFKVHYFEQNNIHRIKQLINTSPTSQTLPEQPNQMNPLDYDYKQQSAGNRKQIQTSQHPSDALIIKQKVQNIIKLTLSSEENNQPLTSIMLDKAIFKQKIKDFINSFKPANLQKKQSLETIGGEGSRCVVEPSKSEGNIIREEEFDIGNEVYNGGFSKKKRRKKQQQRTLNIRKKVRINKNKSSADLQCPDMTQSTNETIEIMPSKPRLTRNSLKANSQENVTLELTKLNIENPPKVKSKTITKTKVQKKQLQNHSIDSQFKQAIIKQTKIVEESIVVKKSQRVMIGQNNKIEIKQTKKIEKKKQKSQQKQSVDYALLRYEEMLISNLPSRNPTIQHLHNSTPNESISLFQDLKINNLYYASDILRYNLKHGTFAVSCTPSSLNFIEESFRSTRNCKNIPLPPEAQLKKIKLKRNFQYKNKKILVLDLDQTLVHSQGLSQVPKKDLFPLHFDFDNVTRHYSIRHYAEQFIKNMAQKYYIVVFTSALQGYADCIIDRLDPHENYIQHRLYRNNCYLHGQTYPYIKDLRILNRDLSQVIIVDNSLYAFWFHIDNGIPIAPFLGPQDDELVKLQQYLLKLQNVDDVRKINRRAFHMHLFQQCNNTVEFMTKYCDFINKENGCSEGREKRKKKSRQKKQAVIEVQ